jgi:hypothetical protein
MNPYDVITIFKLSMNFDKTIGLSRAPLKRVSIA